MTKNLPIYQALAIVAAIALLGRTMAAEPEADDGPPVAVFIGAGFFDTDGQATEVADTLTNSGFGTALLEVHFQADGSIRSNEKDLIKGGEWVAGEPSKRDLARLMRTVNRVEIWFAGWSRRDYDAIRKVRASEQATTELLANLAVVKRMGFAGVTDDDEDVYDTDLAIWMGKQIIGSGLRLSIAPYKHLDHWRRITEEVGVDRIYYQSYHPGRKLAGWDRLKGSFWPGLNTDTDSVADARAHFAEWAKNPSVTGGFFWSHGIIKAKRGGDYRGYARVVTGTMKRGDNP